MARGFVGQAEDAPKRFSGLNIVRDEPVRSGVVYSHNGTGFTICKCGHWLGRTAKFCPCCESKDSDHRSNPLAVMLP